MKYLENFKKVVPCHSYSKVKNENSLFIKSENLLFVLTMLKRHVNYKYAILTCISGVDFFHSKYRFSAVYELLSLVYNNRIRVKIFVNETTAINSSVSVFKNAN